MVDRLILPEGYSSALNLAQTQRGIKVIKDTFEKELSAQLNVERVSAPLFVRPETGLNDDLNGVERPVSFDIKELGADVQIVHSLAKWKRYILKKYNYRIGKGIYTDMNAIRRDEDLDNLHSVYVDQWDWEKVMDASERTVDYLKDTVSRIVEALKITQKAICDRYPVLKPVITEDVFFITSQELEDMYPNLTPKQRENAITKEHKTVFIMQIGCTLKSGNKHDGRAPDYDDWSLNGDILIWYDLLDCAVEISSMGIRVDKDTLLKQLEIAGCSNRLQFDFHKALINGDLPQTIGGGIGQSRVSLLMLNKAHIGEVQTTVWSDEMQKVCAEKNIFLL